MIVNILPQKGPQELFLSTNADIAIYGGSAGSGKTFGLLLDYLRHYNNQKARAVFFRRTRPQLTAPGGIWDESKSLYNLIQAEPKESTLEWIFSSGARVKMSHIEYEKNIYDWQGAQIPVIYFDELTHFTEKMFFYLLSRNRTNSGIKPYVRGTCNPDPNSFVRKLIDWWISEDGYPVKERSGKIRWFIRLSEEFIWGDSKEELKEKYPESEPKSLTFIAATLEDNQILLKQDPAYKANLMAMSKVDRLRLLGGNWDVKESAGMFFKRDYFQEVDAHPKLVQIVRCWDRAATEGDKGDPDYTASVKLGRDRYNQFYVLDTTRDRLSALKVERLIKNTASQDGTDVTAKGFQDPGGAGKNEIENFVRMLSGFHVVTEKISVDKVTAAKPASAQCEAGNVFVLSSCRNKEKFYGESEEFPDGNHDDIVDAFTGAFNYLTEGNVAEWHNDDLDLEENEPMDW